MRQVVCVFLCRRSQAGSFFISEIGQACFRLTLASNAMSNRIYTAALCIHTSGPHLTRPSREACQPRASAAVRAIKQLTDAADTRKLVIH
jgi:hypothetical protein